MGRKLPNWLSIREGDGQIMIDPDIAYPFFFKEFGFDENNLTQYEIEVAYQAAKMMTQDLLTGTELDPRTHGRGFVMEINSEGPRKDRWKLTSFKEGVPGRDVNAATKGKLAKAHYGASRTKLLRG